jgi:hypothetical protein
MRIKIIYFKFHKKVFLRKFYVLKSLNIILQLKMRKNAIRYTIFCNFEPFR